MGTSSKLKTGGAAIAQYLMPTVGAVFGIGATILLASFAPVVISVSIGAPITIIATGLSSYRKKFAFAGTAYTLGLGILLATGAGPDGYQQTAMLALLGFGVLSGLIVVVRGIGKFLTKQIAKRTAGEEKAGAVWSAISSSIGLAMLIWTTITAWEKAARYGGISGVGTATFILNILGFESVAFRVDKATAKFSAEGLLGQNRVEAHKPNSRR